MKTKKLKAALCIAVLIFLSGLLYSFINQPGTQPPPSPNTGDKFLIGVMNSYGFLTNYDLAGGLNISHNYLYGESHQFQNDTSRYTPASGLTGEHLMGSIPVDAIHRVLDTLNNHNNS